MILPMSVPMEDVGLIARQTSSTIAEIYKLQMEGGDVGNVTQALISTLVFAESKSVRTSTIILGSFNILASVGTAASILYDCYWASKRASTDYKAEKFCVSKIHPAETFPLVLALGIVIQGLAFAGASSTGMTALFTTGCDNIAQYIFPALFLVPFIQLVFGLECTIRSLRKLPFEARGKYDVTICLIIIVLMTAATWIPTHVNPESSRCFATLMWFVTNFGLEGLVMLSTVAGLSILAVVVIFLRLSTTLMIDHNQRIAASRMVYYLVLSVVSLAFVLPWFITLVRGKPSIITSMIATVVLNLSGLMNGALHLFLRSNIATTSFGPSDSQSWRRQTHEIRIWGPNELGFGNHLLQPVSGPRSESRTSLRMEKGEFDGAEMPRTPPYSRDNEWQARFNPLRVNEIRHHAVELPAQARVGLPASPCPTLRVSDALSPRRHQRKQSYSLFPTEGPQSPTSQQIQLPSTAFSPSRPIDQSHPVLSNPNTQPSAASNSNIYLAEENLNLELPPSFHFIGSGGTRHRRDSSMASSATVVFGLRLSNIEDNLNENPLPTAYQTDSRRPTSLLRPASTLAPPRSLSPRLKVTTQNLWPKYLMPESGQKLMQKEQDSRMKTLPPVPNVASAVIATNSGVATSSSPVRRDATNPSALESALVASMSPSAARLRNLENAEASLQLSPTVYSPVGSKKRSKKEVATEKLSKGKPQKTEQVLSPRDLGISSPLESRQRAQIPPLKSVLKQPSGDGSTSDKGKQVARKSTVSWI